MSNFSFSPVGDSAISIVCGNSISEKINNLVISLDNAIKQADLSGIIETVPTYTSLLVIYNPIVITFNQLIEQLHYLSENLSENVLYTGKIIEIPVCYGGKYGIDLKYVAEYAKLTEKEVIKLHSNTDYRIYMIGFMPAFPYLGGLDSRIACPRLQTPRTKIPAGSVGIGGNQTGIYPISSPGGWRIIGTTPLNLFNPNEKSLYNAGDKIRFIPISETEFLNLK